MYPSGVFARVELVCRFNFGQFPCRSLAKTPGVTIVQTRHIVNMLNAKNIPSTKSTSPGLDKEHKYWSCHAWQWFAWFPSFFSSYIMVPLPFLAPQYPVYLSQRSRVNVPTPPPAISN